MSGIHTKIMLLLSSYAYKIFQDLSFFFLIWYLAGFLFLFKFVGHG